MLTFKTKKLPYSLRQLFFNGRRVGLEERRFSGRGFSNERRTFVSFEVNDSVAEKLYKWSDRSAVSELANLQARANPLG